MAGWLTLTLISAGFPKMTKIALILLFHVLPILSRYQLPMRVSPQRMKVKSKFIEVTSRHCIFQNLGCVVQERKRKKEVGLRENAEGTKGKILGILFLGCGLSYVISKAWSAEKGGTLFCSHLKWSTCRINFQHPLQFRLLVFTHYTSKHVPS